MPSRKVHYSELEIKAGSFEESYKTLCGKVLKSYGNFDPVEEVMRDAFLSWSKDDRCKICEERMVDLYTCDICEKDMDDCKCTDEDFFGPEDEFMK